jgi:hypothetical protein
VGWSGWTVRAGSGSVAGCISDQQRIWRIEGPVSPKFSGFRAAHAYGAGRRIEGDCTVLYNAQDITLSACVLHV